MTHAARKHRYRRRYGAADRSLLERLEALCKGEVIKGALHGTHGDTAFRLRLSAQSQRTIVSVVCPEAGRFRMTRATRWDHWLASFLPSWTLYSRDTRFLHDVCVQTRDVELTTHVLHDEACRRTLRQLLEGKGRHVLLDGDRVKLSLPRAELGKTPEPEAVLQLVEQLALIEQRVESYRRNHEVRMAPKHDTPKVLAWSSLLTLFVLGLATFLVGQSQYQLLHPTGFLLTTLGLGVCLWPFAAFALAHLVAARTAPGRLLTPLALLALFVMPLLTSGSAYALNGLLDEHVAEARHEPVVDTRSKQQDKKLRHFVGIDSWWRPGDTRWFRVDRATHDAVRAGGAWAASMTLRPGAFGQPWIQSLSFVRVGT